MKSKAVFSETIGADQFNLSLWNKILKINMLLVENRMIYKYGWGKDRVSAAVHDYRKFLYLTQVYGAPVSPTGDIDEIWHQHILHTNKYFLDCMKTFGKFLHHLPTPARTKEVNDDSKNCSSPCCNHADCCNDNPVIDRLPGKVVVTSEGDLNHELCEPIADGCVPIGGSEDYCSGTTNDGFSNNFTDYDTPDSQVYKPSVSFSVASSTIFKS